MKKIAVLMTALTLLSSSAFTQEKKTPPPCPSSPNEFAWGIGLIGIAVIGVVAGLTASMASD
jgi:hypothetical protein